MSCGQHAIHMRRHLFSIKNRKFMFAVEKRERKIYFREVKTMYDSDRFTWTTYVSKYFQKFNGHSLDLKRNCADCRPPIHVWRSQTVFVWSIPVDIRLASSCACGNDAIILLAKHSAQPWIMHFDSIFRLSLRFESPFRMDCSLIAIDGCMHDFIYQQTKLAHRKWSNTVGLS